MFSKAFSFNGRIRRTEFGISLIIYFIVSVVISISNVGTKGFQIFGLLYIPLLWFLYAQAAKRCHDVDKSGWWQLIPFYIFWMIFEKGTIGPNRFDVGHEIFYGADDYERPYSIDNDSGNAPGNEQAPTA